MRLLNRKSRTPFPSKQNLEFSISRGASYKEKNRILSPYIGECPLGLVAQLLRPKWSLFRLTVMPSRLTNLISLSHEISILVLAYFDFFRKPEGAGPQAPLIFSNQDPYMIFRCFERNSSVVLWILAQDMTEGGWSDLIVLFPLCPVYLWRANEGPSGPQK